MERRISRNARRGGRRQGPAAAVTYGLLTLLYTAPLAAQGTVGGVSIDPRGLLTTVSPSETRSGIASTASRPVGPRRPAPPAPEQGGIRDPFRESPLRYVSLRRLAAAAAARHAAHGIQGDENRTTPGLATTDELACLAGLYRIRGVRFVSEERDVLLFGPAGAWRRTDDGDVVHAQSGRPVVLFEHLVVVLRYCFDDDPRDASIGCSIDPTEEGLRRMRAYQSRRRATAAQAASSDYLAGLEAALGPQAVSIYGVPPGSRTALTLIVADYRLKRLVMGHDAPPFEEFTTFVDHLAADPAVARNAAVQQRFWLNGEFDAVRVQADGLEFEFEGSGLRAAAGPARLAGQQGSTEQAPAAAVKYVERLNAQWTRIVARVPIFADLENVVALAAAAALIDARDREAESAAESFRPELLLDPARCRLESLSEPKWVPSLAVGRVVAGKGTLIGVSGGVAIEPASLVERGKWRRNGRPAAAVAPPSESDAWWWDAEERAATPR